jgi:hypothetical protein
MPSQLQPAGFLSPDLVVPNNGRVAAQQNKMQYVRGISKKTAGAAREAVQHLQESCNACGGCGGTLQNV